MNFLLGALAMLAVVTFLPPEYAAKPSEWLRSVVASVKSALNRNRD